MPKEQLPADGVDPDVANRPVHEALMLGDTSRHFLAAFSRRGAPVEEGRMQLNAQQVHGLVDVLASFRG